MTGVKAINAYKHGYIGGRGRATSRAAMSGMDSELGGRTRYTRKREQKKSTVFTYQCVYNSYHRNRGEVKRT